jgi:hypothetical protein
MSQIPNRYLWLLQETEANFMTINVTDTKQVSLVASGNRSKFHDNQCHRYQTGISGCFRKEANFMIINVTDTKQVSLVASGNTTGANFMTINVTDIKRVSLVASGKKRIS